MKQSLKRSLTVFLSLILFLTAFPPMTMEVLAADPLNINIPFTENPFSGCMSYWSVEDRDGDGASWVWENSSDEGPSHGYGKERGSVYSVGNGSSTKNMLWFDPFAVPLESQPVNYSSLLIFSAGSIYATPESPERLQIFIKIGDKETIISEFDLVQTPASIGIRLDEYIGSDFMIGFHHITSGTGSIWLDDVAFLQTVVLKQVTFDSMGGSDVALQNVEYGSSVVRPPDPKKGTCTFLGWYQDPQLKVPFDFSTVIHDDLTLYAKWDASGTPLGKNTISPDAPASAKAIENMILSQTTDDDLKGASYSLLQAKGKAKSKTAITLSWKKVKGAGEYIIYGNKCGKNKRLEKITSVKGKTWTQKKRKKGTYYKYVIAAVKGSQVLAVSKTIHVATEGGKVGNHTAVKLKETKLTLKAGKSKTIKPTLVKGPLKVKTHRKVAFESSNIQIATVSKRGKIKAKAKGTCFIYAYAQNGMMAKVKVKVV